MKLLLLQSRGDDSTDNRDSKDHTGRNVTISYFKPGFTKLKEESILLLRSLRFWLKDSFHYNLVCPYLFHVLSLADKMYLILLFIH